MGWRRIYETEVNDLGFEWAHMRAVEILCERTDPDRLLWGSDFGYGFADPVGYRLSLIREARIDDGLRARILGVNPFRLLEAG